MQRKLDTDMATKCRNSGSPDFPVLSTHHLYEIYYISPYSSSGSSSRNLDRAVAHMYILYASSAAARMFTAKVYLDEAGQFTTRPRSNCSTPTGSGNCLILRGDSCTAVVLSLGGPWSLVQRAMPCPNFCRVQVEIQTVTTSSARRLIRKNGFTHPLIAGGEESHE